MPTYTKTLSSNPKSVEQRCRRLAKRKGMLIHKHRGASFDDYWCDGLSFLSIDDILEYLETRIQPERRKK